ncbi:hypothetical protein CARUB_v10024819mg, partial [Capsella rubella]
GDQNGAELVTWWRSRLLAPLLQVPHGGALASSSSSSLLESVWPRYRLNEEKAEWIIYVTDAGQQEHFDRFFKKMMETSPRVSHVKFGVVKGEDGKWFRNRDREIVHLADLLDEAKTRSKTALIERAKDKEWTPEELDQTAEAIGYGAYADMKKNISTDYRFSYDEMLSDTGNTAVYLLYAHARICSIIQKSGKDIWDIMPPNGVRVAMEIQAEAVEREPRF